MGQALRTLYQIFSEWSSCLLCIASAVRPQTQVKSVHEKEPVKILNNEAHSVNSESPTFLEKCTSTSIEEKPAVRKRKSKSPMWPYPPPDNFSAAVANIHSAGLSHTLTPRGLASLDLLLWEFPWKASNPRHRNNPLMTEITSKWRKSLPDLYPILDNLWWSDMDSRPHLVEPFPYVMVLFGTPSGYFFVHDGIMMTVGTDLEKFMEGLLEGKHWTLEDEEPWEEILDDEEAEIEARNAQQLC